MEHRMFDINHLLELGVFSQLIPIWQVFFFIASLFPFLLLWSNGATIFPTWVQCSLSSFIPSAAWPSRYFLSRLFSPSNRTKKLKFVGFGLPSRIMARRITRVRYGTETLLKWLSTSPIPTSKTSDSGHVPF